MIWISKMHIKYFLILILFNSTLIAQTPFSKGVNITNWFQSESAGQIQFSKYTKQDFENIKSLGADVIRLPINLHYMTTGTDEYLLDPLFLFFLDHAIDWAEELEINLILDNHSFNPAVDTNPNVEQILIPVWKQLAEHCKDRLNLIYYEVLNEPHGISDLVWNNIQQNTINEIRKIDSVHTIIVGPAGWNSYHNLKYIPEYSDTNIIYTFHFYDPFIFTHQGASWTNPSMVELEDVPFPYNATNMPALPNSLKGSWIENSFNNYQVDGTVQKLKELIDIVVEFKTQRNVEMFCGEFGVYKPNSSNEDRIFWYEEVRKYFEDNSISWTVWDYKHGYGIFETGTNELFNYDLNIPLVEALGFNVPPQYEFQYFPDSTGAVIYSDYINQNIYDVSYTANAELNYYSDEAVEGDFCIKWSGALQYGSISLDYIPNKDFSYLLEENYFLSMWIKGDAQSAEIDIRFVDTKTDVPEDHPWRMGVTINSSTVSLDNNWHKLNIPINEFSEKGSWDNNAWFDPLEEFDWGAIDRFEIVAEHHDLTNINFWFDQIEIIHPDLVNVEQNNMTANDFSLGQNYPNPFNPTTTIRYVIPPTVSANKIEPQQQFIQVKIYDILGKEVASLINKEQRAGYHQVTFDASKLSSGIYFYQLRAGKISETKKMILNK